MQTFSLKLAVLSLIVITGAPTANPADEDPVRSVLDPGVITTRQALTPAGLQTVFIGRVHAVAFGATNDTVFALTDTQRAAQMYRLDWSGNKVVERAKAAVTPGMQSMAFDAVGQRVIVAGVGRLKTESGTRDVVQLFGMAGNTTNVLAPNLGQLAVGGVAVASMQGGARVALVALTFNNELAIVDLATGAARKVKTGIAPFGVTVNTSGTVAYVSNWGGRFPKPGDRTAATGPNPKADQVVVDARGIAASGTVARVDLNSGAVTHSIDVGLHPASLAWDESRSRLYVANSNSDTISVIDTARNALVEHIAIQPFERPVAGVAPEALVLSKDRRHLYVACAGLNAVAVVSLGASGGDRIEGLIPTGWYPTHVALSPDGNYLAVSTLLGVGSGARKSEKPRERYVHANRGTLQVIPIPDAAQLAGYTTAVAENNRLRLRALPAARRLPQTRASQALPVPVRAGDPSLIEHVVYVIKENRSYDQMFGDLGKGNGDPSLALFGDDIVPNQRKLAREFVLLDNFYATGGNSADGHQWVTQASETDYTYWPGYGGRSYPKNGDDPLAFANSGFLWDNTLQGNRTFQDFGEFVGSLQGVAQLERVKFLEQYRAGEDFQGRFETVAPIAPLNRHLIKDYPAYGLQVPDVVRAHIFLRHLKAWEEQGKMPNLVMVQLPSDHTAGTTPGFSTPKACLADNDLATGQIVEALSKSKFWKRMLILVVEDDAQAGVDHVDGHRTVALAISPYIRRGAIDSTFYSQTSLVKTIELILGRPTMSLFDLIANDMRNSFQLAPDYRPFTAEVPRQSIYDVSPRANTLRGPARKAAEESARMNFQIPDAAPTEKVNRMIWASVRGWETPYPVAKRGVFLPAGPEEDDDER